MQQMHLLMDLNISLLWISFFQKWNIPTSLPFIFVFSNKNYNFYNKCMKKVHPVYDAWIRNHDLQNTSLLR